jgi:hypothetical protein
MHRSSHQRLPDRAARPSQSWTMKVASDGELANIGATIGWRGPGRLARLDEGY